ncbi:hypothetical protein BO70DRAFT_368623 [Aspergillus heteromorphus CBS 117.55]|uniref:BTB domain-containing protein n=1 Tax=Aspergillus heteromorphus CBS 117.55 TaxID=1448321 RepID=A0A317WVD1_9EURO|nr:uncharacterized protein BO70DRAFT_368623 [Aspergillus heteromorphus CBS 117.55]PWY90035.1 hypothetical protein BO70DRAFT_368623 [Aspergillus heteromorphus CBS 117.55]
MGSEYQFEYPEVEEGAPLLPDLDQSDAPYKVILKTGNIVVEYLGSDSDREVGGSVQTQTQAAVRNRRWRVSSEELMRNSPYFGALLDPEKFREGRQFLQRKMMVHRGGLTSEPGNSNGHAFDDEQSPPPFTPDPEVKYLPVIALPSQHFSAKLGVDAIELFLEILCFRSFDEELKAQFNAKLKVLPVSLIARLLELADAFNSPLVVRDTLKRAGYAFGKGKFTPSKFDPSLLKLSEDRIRQTIFVARILNEPVIFQVMTHALLVMGSKAWVNGVERPDCPVFPWRYLSNGIEEELYFRRQCVLNTITDLQAYFLRAYGGLEDPDPKPRPPAPGKPSLSVPLTTLQPRLFQCRYAYGNSSACDAFHLGQMTRFFSLRTKTIFLGSTLIDPDFALDPSDDDSDDEPDHFDSDPHSQHPPTDITAILAALKQCPDYQIDPNHIGCGVRRRFTPPLDCIERFVGDGRGLLGVDILSWPSISSTTTTTTSNNTSNDINIPIPNNRTPTSWTNRTLPRAHIIDIRFSRINAIPLLSRGTSTSRNTTTSTTPRLSPSQEENARLLFTAKKRNWEA